MARVGAGTGAGARPRGRLRWHASVNSLSDSDVRDRAAGRLFHRDHRSVFSRSSSRNDGADRLARTRHSCDAVNFRCGVRSQDVSS